MAVGSLEGKALVGLTVGVGEGKRVSDGAEVVGLIVGMAVVGFGEGAHDGP
jgi:hypothetical protein